MGDRVDFTGGAEQGRDQEGPAPQALGIAEGVDRDIEPSTLAGEGLQGGGHHYRGDVFGVELGDTVAGIDPQPLEHGNQALLGEGRF